MCKKCIFSGVIFNKKSNILDMEYTKGTKVIHKHTLANETVVGCCKMKCNGEWIDGVIYEGIDRFSGQPMTFVRSKKEFEQEFILAEWYGN